MKTKCPYCSYIATEHETLDDKNKKPKDGDPSFCINCGEVGMFKSVGIIKVSLSSFDVETQEEIKRITDAWLRTRAMSKLTQRTETTDSEVKHGK